MLPLMEAPQGFTARRSAASGLPTFQLPPPDPFSGMPKFPAYTSMSTTQPTPALVGTVLTPPAGLSGDLLSPIASSVNSGSSGSSTTSGPPYQPMGYWPTPQSSSYTSSSAPSMPAPFAQQQQPQQQNLMSRSLYSPNMNFQNRTPTSPSASDGLPPPPYDVSLPPFPTSMSMSASSGGQQYLPNLAPQHPQHQQQMGNQHVMNSQQPPSQNPPQGPPHAHEQYGGRPPPTPTYYTPSSTPQQTTFPAFAQHSPPQQSPITTSAPQNRMSPISAPLHNPIDGPQPPYGSRPYSYNLPAMAAPIMSNLHSPGSQMSLVGGMNMHYSPNPMGGQIYHHQGMQQQQQNDRPFKCDQCQQSFNRNHDLKRHKRIHLAVKPFPCGHCEKSFSRRDALKRHILVKGCGKSPTSATNQSGESQSPVERSETMDGSVGGDSPSVLKKEL